MATQKEWSDEMLINRDPNEMNRFVHVQFEDVLAEPPAAHSSDW